MARQAIVRADLQCTIRACVPRRSYGGHFGVMGKEVVRWFYFSSLVGWMMPPFSAQLMPKSNASR